MINMIVAIDSNGAIGKSGGLPWRIAEDLRTFKALTMGGVLFVGKKTAKNLPTLIGREVVVLNRNEFPTLADINTHPAWVDKPKWIIGGAEIYAAALDMGLVDKVYLTIINEEHDADTYLSFEQMQKFQNDNWELVNSKVLRETDPLVTLDEWVKKV